MSTPATHTKFALGDRVRVDEPTIQGQPNDWHGQTGTIVRTPGMRGTSTYAMSFDGREGTFAPFRDASQTDERYGMLIVSL